ncbi:MAG: hydrogenase expression/formation protein HypE [Desulfovibrio sp.]|nr:hydrogenase expression/formation protein HypE [Desulfovibrio sp.]
MSKVLLDAGSGGRASQCLIADIFQKAFDNQVLNVLDDAALLPDLGARLVMSTDSYTVTPLFFPGGSIGSLAVHGTVNDVSMLGADPLYLSCGFIVEEGLEIDTLEAIVGDMANAAKTAGVSIVTGDTKVVPHGGCDQIFINTTGIGRSVYPTPPSGHNAKPGDVVLVTGAMGDHGLTIMAMRNALSMRCDLQSDSAPLNGLVAKLLKACSTVHVLRDPTRGGLATTLNEIAGQSQVGIRLYETKIPVHENVRSVCSIMGLDPLYLANEGKCIVIVGKEEMEKALGVLRSDPLGVEACVIGEVIAEKIGRVVLQTPLGGERLLGMLEGAQLPRIC